VTTVESAADALALLKDDPKAFDLVLTGAPPLALARDNPISGAQAGRALCPAARPAAKRASRRANAADALLAPARREPAGRADAAGGCADVLMPEADGFELMELIQTGLNLSTPVVMMSTDDGDVRLKSLRSGAAQFLPKPVRPDELQSLWQVGLGGSAGHTPAGTPRTGSFDIPAGGPARSISLDQLDEAGVAAGMTAGALLLQRRSDELARSAPGAESAFPQPVSSSRVERLLKEREMRRVRSLTGLTLETLGLEAEATEASAPSPQPMRTREPSIENLAALAEPEPRQRLIVVANRLPVSAKKRADGAWALEVRGVTCFVLLSRGADAAFRCNCRSARVAW
jgi:CheY-like chemotaxis protein